MVQVTKAILTSYHSAGLFVAINAIHYALIIDAVLKTKHMTYFMHHNSTGVVQQSPLSSRILYTLKLRVISNETKHSRPINETS